MMTDVVFDHANKTLDLGYSRKSQEAEDKQVTSNEDQIQILKSNALSKFNVKLPVSNIFTDNKTGQHAGVRPGFNQLRKIITEAIKDGYKVRLHLWDIKRSARNGEEGGYLADLVKFGDLTIVTDIGGNFDQTNFFMLYIYFGVGSQESKNVSDGVKRNNDFKIRQGIYPGKSPLGYMFNPNKLKGERDHVPAFNFELLREWIDLLLTGENDIRKSLDIMTAKGLRGKKGEPLSETTAYRFLHDIFNTGLFEMKSGKSKGIHRGIHKPLMTMAEYNRLQKIITRGKQTKQETLWFMNELFHCDACGSAITGYKRVKKYKNGTNSTWLYSKCSNKNGNCPSTAGPTVEDLNNQVKNKVLSMNFTPRFIDWMRKVVKKQNKHEIDRVKKDHELLTKRLNDVRTELNKVFDKKAEGFYTNRPELYEEDKASCLKQEKIILDEMGGDKTAFYRGLMEDKVSFIEKMERLAQSEHPVVRRILVKILGSNLTIKGKQILIDPKKSFIALQKIQHEVLKELSSIEPQLLDNKIDTTSQTAMLRDDATVKYRVRESNP